MERLHEGQRDVIIKNNMTLYGKIKQGAKHGLYSLVQHKEVGFILVSPFKDDYGNYRESGLVNTFEDTLSCVGDLRGSDEQDWGDNEEDHKFIRYVSHAEIIKPEPYKDGDLVDVLEIARECPNFDRWNDNRKDMVGKKGLEIHGVYNDTGGFFYCVRQKDKKNWLSFRHEFLAPHIPEGEEFSDDELSAMRLLKEKGYKITKE